MAANNLTLYRGDTFTVDLALTTTSSSGTINFDLTNYQAQVDLRWSRSSRNFDRVSLYSTASTLTLGATAGTVSGTFATTDTTCLPDNVKYYLVLTTTTPSRQTYFLGNVKVLSSQTSLDTCST